MTVQVLVDADNVRPPRLQPVLDLLGQLSDVDVVGSGHPAVLGGLDWPAGARLLPHAGWQRADLALAESYQLNREPLILVTGDGDFGLLAARHPGPVLVISGAPSNRLRDTATVLDPATDGIPAIRRWIEQQT